MTAITLGNKNKFLKGIAEQTYYDPTTGNIVGYDNVASDGAIESAVNLQQIEAGMGNAVVGVIPDSTRLTGSYTSQAFSLETRRLISGGKLSYNGISSVCETITASGATLTVTKTPAKHYGQSASDTTAWCYVKEHTATTFAGTNYGVDITSKEVQNFVATNGVQYDVFYFTVNASAQVLELPDSFNPSVVTVQTKYGVYSKQNNSVTGGTFQGWLYVVVPQAILTGNAGVSATQTSNSTTDGSWMAISPDNNIMACADCGATGNTLAYYVFVPCEGATSAVEALVVVGGGVTVTTTTTKQIPVKYIMPDQTVVTPTYTDLDYESAAEGTATVTDGGVVAGVAQGSTIVTITLEKGDGTTLTTTCNVTVTTGT
ncbi:MAG: hypothetical protein IKU30_02250 [Clostridia bacterium]|nr:hypothetical protein [Clostridia bacterium]